MPTADPIGRSAKSKGGPSNTTSRTSTDTSTSPTFGSTITTWTDTTFIATWRSPRFTTAAVTLLPSSDRDSHAIAALARVPAGEAGRSIHISPRRCSDGVARPYRSYRQTRIHGAAGTLSHNGDAVLRGVCAAAVPRVRGHRPRPEDAQVFREAGQPEICDRV